MTDADYTELRRLCPIGARVRFSHLWLKDHPYRTGVEMKVVGHSVNGKCVLVIPDGKKSRQSYHLSFVEPIAAEREGREEV